MNNMNLTDILILGWKKVIEKTKFYHSSDEEFGSKEHSFFIIFLFYGMNIWTISSYLFIEYFHSNIHLFWVLIIWMVVLSIGYLIYFKNKRINRIIMIEVSNIKILFFVLFSLLYAAVSIYLMFQVGNYVRFKLGHG
jgi:hypothetical protein